MIEALQSCPKGAVWVDMGGGTGHNIEVMAKYGKLENFSKVYIVDLSTSLLKVASDRIKTFGWKNVEVVEADATSWVPKKKSRLNHIFLFIDNDTFVV